MTPPIARIAVATRNGQQIDLHFGHAEAFHIFAVDGQKVAFLEQREVAHYCQGGIGDEDQREVILRTLADCQALFVARVGGGPAERLRAAGIEPVTDFPYADPLSAMNTWLTARGAPA